MTDDEAVKVLGGFYDRSAMSPKLRAAVDHALRAIKDRAAICRFTSTVLDREKRADALVAARRHMRGEADPTSRSGGGR